MSKNIEDTQEIRRWLHAGVKAVKRARGSLDAINVFPVADADTGTNLYLTLQQGNRAVAKLPANASHKEVVAAFARGTLLGARGNSGVIMSQYLAGFLREIDHSGGLNRANGEAIARSLDAAQQAAFKAVMNPVEGTILSVAKAAAEAAQEIVETKHTDRIDVIVGAVSAARRALQATQEQLPGAKKAGVVDAGAAGLLLQLEMLAEVIAGPAATAHLQDVRWQLAPDGPETQALERMMAGNITVEGGRFEVMFVVDVEGAGAEVVSEQGAEQLSAELTALGDSVAVTLGDDVMQAHVHTDAPDEAVAAGLRRQAVQIVVQSVALGHGVGTVSAGMVALVESPGIAEPLADAGAVVLVCPPGFAVRGRHLKRAIKDAAGGQLAVLAGSPRLAEVALKRVSKKPRRGVSLISVEHDAAVVAAVAAGSLVTPGEDVRHAVEDAASLIESRSWNPADWRTGVDTLDGNDVEVLTLVVNTDEVDTAALSRALRKAAPLADVHLFPAGFASDRIAVAIERGLA